MITVLMPTYKQAPFIVRAIKSLLSQDFTYWELIVINDGSPDNTRKMVEPFLSDSRMRYFEHAQNEGLGYCLNRGFERARFDLIAYLPSDDIYYHDHLQRLYTLLSGDEGAVMAYSAVESEDRRMRGEDPVEYSGENRIQLVQLLHRRTEDRWIERAELVSDDYDRLFLEKLGKRGRFISHDRKTCAWINHPAQRTKIIGEKFGGGLNKYKAFYHIREPLKFQSGSGPYIDELQQYKDFRSGPVRKNGQGLKIVLVGELSYHPERVCALEERGHTLYGLWMPDPTSACNNVGPLPFGHIEDIPYEGWEARIQEIKPDIMYALLNTQPVLFAHEVLKKKRDIPFVWHIKENPLLCIRSGIWRELFELYTLSDGRIFNNQESKEWFDRVLPETDRPVFIMDGELPASRWFQAEQSPLLSDLDGEIHTVIAGRPVGFDTEDVVRLARMKIHLHFYGEAHQYRLKKYVLKLQELVGDYLHLHPNASQGQWVREFSQYDAGWLHLSTSNNEGDIMKVLWSDLNYPARMATYANAGLPTIARDNSGNLVAAQRLAQRLDSGIFFKTIEELGDQLRDKARMKELRENAWKSRGLFQFDSYTDALIGFFEQVIRRHQPFS